MPTTATDVGALIRAELGRQRVTIVELSRRTEIPRSTLSFQINSSSLTVNSLLAIAGALGVRASSLLGEAAA